MAEISVGVISSLFHHTPYLSISEDHLRSQYQETNSTLQLPHLQLKNQSLKNPCPFIPANIPSDAKITDADNTCRMSFNW